MYSSLKFHTQNSLHDHSYVRRTYRYMAYSLAKHWQEFIAKYMIYVIKELSATWAAELVQYFANPPSALCT